MSVIHFSAAELLPYLALSLESAVKYERHLASADASAWRVFLTNSGRMADFIAFTAANAVEYSTRYNEKTDAVTLSDADLLRLRGILFGIERLEMARLARGVGCLRYNLCANPERGALEFICAVQMGLIRRMTAQLGWESQ